MYIDSLRVCTCRCREAQDLVQKLTGLFPLAWTSTHTQATINSAAANAQLESALQQDSWRTAFLMTHTDPNTPTANLPTRPESPADALDKTQVAFTTCLVAFNTADAGQTQGMEMLWARHACCTALMQLFFSIGLPMPNTGQLQSGQTASMSQIIALARCTGASSTTVTCWPHVMAESGTLSTASRAEAEAEIVTVLLHQACASVARAHGGAGTAADRTLSPVILDLALVQAMSHACGSQASDSQEEEESDVSMLKQLQLAAWMPDLASLLQHLVTATEHGVRQTFEQRLNKAGQQEKVEEVVAVLQLGLNLEQVSSLGQFGAQPSICCEAEHSCKDTTNSWQWMTASIHDMPFLHKQWALMMFACLSSNKQHSVVHANGFSVIYCLNLKWVHNNLLGHQAQSQVPLQMCRLEMPWMQWSLTSDTPSCHLPGNSALPSGKPALPNPGPHQVPAGIPKLNRLVQQQCEWDRI